MPDKAMPPLHWLLNRVPNVSASVVSSLRRIIGMYGRLEIGYKRNGTYHWLPA